MNLLEPNNAFFGSAAKAVQCDADCSVYRMEDESGEGFMTCYPVFQGVYVIYNDFHMTNCYSRCKPRWKILEINHCREGRIECEFENGTCIYMEKGDLAIAFKDIFCTSANLPLHHYHGISITIDLEEAPAALAAALGVVSIDLEELREKLYTKNRYYVMRANESISHIFSELYRVPDVVKRDYFKIKVLELLLFLKAADIPGESEKRPYYPKSQVDTVKDIMRFMTRHMDKHHTLPELSERFAIPLTTMKNCFKGVYGTSIYAYMRSFRMQSAAFMLKETRDPIIEIAGRVGYDNPSKFAAAFRQVMGRSPLEYRKTNV